jgi:hypothetical protein
MQDIDFDEIDRAVNSMANTAADAPAMVVTDSQTNTQPVAPQQTVEPAATQEVVASPVVPSPAARRSSGRFMDVVHSSSDMRPSALERSSAPSVPNLHREAVPEREEVASRPEPAAALSAAFHWPDPIDLAQPTPSPVEIPSVVIEPSVPEVTPEVIEEPTPTPLPEDLIDDDEDVSPLESPFLSDAKVEKRPLGAFSGADADLPLLEDPIPFSTNITPDPATAGVVEEPSHEEHEEVPHELHETLLVLDGHGQDEPEALLEATNPPDPVIAEAVPAGPTSISQQYKEQPSTDSTVSGSIFDTEAYHKALTHPPKKRSSVLVVVWILALILVGGGIGAAIYFVVLPMLG